MGVRRDLIAGGRNGLIKENERKTDLGLRLCRAREKVTERWDSKHEGNR